MDVVMRPCRINFKRSPLGPYIETNNWWRNLSKKWRKSIVEEQKKIMRILHNKKCNFFSEDKKHLICCSFWIGERKQCTLFVNWTTGRSHVSWRVSGTMINKKKENCREFLSQRFGKQFFCWQKMVLHNTPRGQATAMHKTTTKRWFTTHSYLGAFRIVHDELPIWSPRDPRDLAWLMEEGSLECRFRAMKHTHQMSKKTLGDMVNFRSRWHFLIRDFTFITRS